MNSLENSSKNIVLKGKIGDIIRRNESVWVQKIPEDNPGLFDAFYNPDAPVFKTMWHGEFPGKLLTGISQTYLLGRSPATRQVGDAFAERFKAAQREDGYLGPWREEEKFERDVKPDTWGKWDTWGQYHCIFGLYLWYKVTGNRDAFEVAKKALDNIYNHFILGGIPITRQNWAECNLAIGHAFAKFFNETGDEKYLKAAEHIVNCDWKVDYLDFYTKSITNCNWLEAAKEGKAFYESGQPRWEGLYALETLAELYKATGNCEYKDAVGNLYRGMRDNDRHNTGSFGTGEGATGNPYGLGSETCNTVAWMAFTADYLKLFRDSTAADELELSFYNAVLGSLLKGERDFTYMNSSNGSREAAKITLHEQAFIGGGDMSCCQANGNRGLTEVADWAILKGAEDEIYINYLGPMSAEIMLSDGSPAKIIISGGYPSNGDVQIKICTLDKRKITLFVRVPEWSCNTEVTMNGENLKAESGKYLKIRRSFTDVDTIVMKVDMSIRKWYWRSEECTKVSYYYGPVLLAKASGQPLPDDETIVKMILNINGAATELVDYYSAGRDGREYITWIREEKE